MIKSKTNINSKSAQIEQNNQRSINSLLHDKNSNIGEISKREDYVEAPKEFEDLVNRKSVLYFITPATNDTYNFLMNIFFSQMFDRLYEYADTKGGKLPTPLFLILDEFANIGRIPRFEQILSTCRSYRINISIP